MKEEVHEVTSTHIQTMEQKFEDLAVIDTQRPQPIAP